MDYWSSHMIGGLAIVVLGALLAGNRPQPKAVPLPQGAEEHDVVFKPDVLLGRRTLIRIGDKVIGERDYYRGGQVSEERLYGDFEKNLLHGLSRKWHENGAVWEEHAYEDGVLHGLCRSWNDRGELVGSSQMRQGAGVLRTFHRDGSLRTQCPYKGGRRHGVCRESYRSGAMHCDVIFEDGQEEGRCRYYFENGQLMQEGWYVGGKLHGVMRTWNEAGELVDDVPRYYINGEPVSKERFEEAARSDADLRKSL